MTHINQRRDTAANWTAADPVLQLGEVGWETDTRKSKLGDGVTPWTGLSYTVSTVIVTAADVGLDQVDNTSDLDKPISTATAAALASKMSTGTATTLLNQKANIANPIFTGNPRAPTPTAGDDDTSIATTEFVTDAVDAVSFEAGLSTARPAHREGLAFYETDTERVVVSDGTNWRRISGSEFGNPAVGTGHTLTTAFVAECSVTLPPGRWSLIGKVIFNYSTAVQRNYLAELHDGTTQLDYAVEGNSTNGGMTLPLVHGDLFTVTTTISLRTKVDVVDGTQFTSWAKLVAIPG